MRDDTLLPGKGAYTAVYSRQPDGAWIVYVRGHRHEIHSFARSLRRARENIRDALSLWYDDAEVARRHTALSKELTAKRRRAIRSLQQSGLGTRDIAELLELSQQRVSQIARGTR